MNPTSTCPRLSFTRLSLILLSVACVTFSGCQGKNKASTADLDEAKRLIAQGSYAAAFVRLNHALAEAPRDPEIHLNLGWLYLYTDEDEKALDEWRKAKTLASGRAEVPHLYGSILSDRARQVEAKNPQEALRLQNEAIGNFQESIRRYTGQQIPKNHQVYFDLANALLALNKNKEALDALDDGFEYIPKEDLQTQVDFQLASCSAHAKLKMYDDAIADCRQAQEFTPTSAGKQRIEDMIQNMKLMSPQGPPQPGLLPNTLSPLTPAEEKALRDDGAMD